MSKINNQQGIGLIVFFSAVLAAGAVFLLSTISNNNSRTSNQNATTESLAQAKEALLSYAVSYYLGQSSTGVSRAGIHGLLPCPENKNTSTLSEGTQMADCASTHENSLGRLAWKSLDIPPLKDASGECLWYAVSGGFFNEPKSPMTNADTPGMFQIYNEQAVLAKGATPEDRVVAVVIAPGVSLSYQNRLDASGSGLPCKIARSAVSATDYLDNYLGINNAVVDTVNADQIDDFITSNGLQTNPSLNDQIITITTNDIFNAIKKNNAQYKLKMNTLADTFVTCLANYANNSNNEFQLTSGSGGGTGTPSTCLSDCRDDCDAVRNLCILSSPSGPARAQCQLDRTACRSTCTTTCSSSGGGTSSTTAFNLPWPTPIDVGGDFRTHANYSDSNAVANTLGRFPFTTPLSNTPPFTQDITIDPGCSLSIANDEYRLLWQNWKDHWFYITHTDYLPGASSTQNSTACAGANCLTVNGNSYASLLIFSDSRLPSAPFNQLRQDPYIEGITVAGNLKTELSNYLEGTNATSSTANTSLVFGDYTALTPADQASVNDRIYCINITSAGVTQGYTYNLLTNDPECN